MAVLFRNGRMTILAILTSIIQTLFITMLQSAPEENRFLMVKVDTMS